MGCFKRSFLTVAKSKSLKLPGYDLRSEAYWRPLLALLHQVRKYQQLHGCAACSSRRTIRHSITNAMPIIAPQIAPSYHTQISATQHLQSHNRKHLPIRPLLIQDTMSTLPTPHNIGASQCDLDIALAADVANRAGLVIAGCARGIRCAGAGCVDVGGGHVGFA